MNASRLDTQGKQLEIVARFRVPEAAGGTIGLTLLSSEHERCALRHSNHA